jgi:hypothetical protein
MPQTIRRTPRRLTAAPLATALLLAATLAGCARTATTTTTTTTRSGAADPRVGLKAGRFDAGEAVMGMRVLSRNPSPEPFGSSTNSDLAFTGIYAIQGNYSGFQIWDISNPRAPQLVRGFVCPASQSDVSVYKNLLFVSAEGQGGRLDCGTQGVPEPVSAARIRGIRLFDISDIRNPRYIGNVQTCRGSHTHTVVADPKDPDNVYVYVSGSSGIRSAQELPGCTTDDPNANPNSPLLRIEVIKVPLANPERAAIVSSPRIFQNLTAAPRHGQAPDDIAESRRAIAEAQARGGFVATIFGETRVLPDRMTRPMLDSIAKARGAATASAADSATLRAALPQMIARMFGETQQQGNALPARSQCHDITVYPSLGLAGGACEGHGLLLDIRDPANPVRLDAAADSNFAYWHSATFNNDGTTVLFSDEWGGGGAPKCRASDPKEWGADAIFRIENGKLVFQSYYKLPAPQTSLENCVAHNGSLVPIPGRDVMVQSWYQGGVSVFDFTDPKHPFEIAFFDRGPVDSTRMGNAGTWSVYWYNGNIVSSEIGRGLDVMELTPTPFVSQNEIDAAKTVHMDYFNAQGQPRLAWPPSFALARAYLDQLERSRCLSTSRIAEARETLSRAERAESGARRSALESLAGTIGGDAAGSCDAPKSRKLADAVRELANVRP